eukprot:6800157-Pyramimonas_sp.AAC.1
MLRPYLLQDVRKLWRCRRLSGGRSVDSRSCSSCPFSWSLRPCCVWCGAPSSPVLPNCCRLGLPRGRERSRVAPLGSGRACPRSGSSTRPNGAGLPCASVLAPGLLPPGDW